MADRPAIGPTIGVLSASFGGAYFGELLGGIATRTAAAGGRLICVQTFEAGTYAHDLAEPPTFRPSVAWDHVSAFAVILNGVDREYLAAIQAAGKPVVMLSDSIPEVSCPIVLPDNRTGIEEAVDHLVSHGHRKIAWAGSPVLRDMRERYQAYQDALRKHGLTPDPRLFFDTGNNQRHGGVAAAEAMIAAGMPSTAVITGNDLNAMGLMRTLQEAGYDLPREQAIVGFDDMESIVYLTPSMASIRQQVHVIGQTAADVLLRTLAGEVVPDDVVAVPTTFVPRESCGCPSTLALAVSGRDREPAESPAEPSAEPQVGNQEPRGRRRPAKRSGAVAPSEAPTPAEPASSPDAVDDAEPAAGTPDPVPAVLDSPEALRAALAATLGSGREQSLASDLALTTGVEAISAALDTALEDAGRQPAGVLREALAGLYRLNPLTESLVETMRCVRRYGRTLCATRLAPDDVAGRERVEDCIQEIILALSLSQTRSRYTDTAHFEQVFGSQHAVSMSLLRSSHEEDPRRLDWLQRTSARAATLGLWTDDPAGQEGERVLRVAGSFRAGAQEDPAGPETLRTEAFPPAELVELADLTADEMVFVAPMRVNASDWGFLAVVAPMEVTRITGREVMNQWAALLTIALDHGAVLESLRRQEEALRHAALYDELTGLPNRALFFDRLTYSIERAKRRPDYRFGVFLLDLDGFKIVNDSLGHLAGDQLLVEVAERIQSSLRVNDVAARLGGDEFAVLLDDLADDEGAAVIAERLRVVLGQPCVIDGQEIVVTSTIGVALSSGRYEEPQDVIRDADIAMYSAKVREKGTHAVFDVTMRELAVSRLRIEGDLRRAIDQGELELLYQPIVDLHTGRISAFEALIRWRRPERGLVPPSEFLPIAEECGLMLPVGRWVLTEACRQLSTWRGQGLARDVRMSVNVSNRQFWHGRLLEDLQGCLDVAHVVPQDLGIEITEGVIMHDVKLARGILDGLHDLGVELHIDDFGTGYSSLEALHHLPIDALKIDRSFVTPLGTDQRSEELARAIIAMGTSLGMELVAEGIETSAHRDRLRDLGCTYGQGFWFSRPVPASAAAELMRSALART